MKMPYGIGASNKKNLRVGYEPELSKIQSVAENEDSTNQDIKMLSPEKLMSKLGKIKDNRETDSFIQPEQI